MFTEALYLKILRELNLHYISVAKKTIEELECEVYPQEYFLPHLKENKIKPECRRLARSALVTYIS